MIDCVIIVDGQKVAYYQGELRNEYEINNLKTSFCDLNLIPEKGVEVHVLQS
jgi:hypothetical protein